MMIQNCFGCCIPRNSLLACISGSIQTFVHSFRRRKKPFARSPLGNLGLFAPTRKTNCNGRLTTLVRVLISGMECILVQTVSHSTYACIGQSFLQSKTVKAPIFSLHFGTDNSRDNRMTGLCLPLLHTVQVSAKSFALSLVPFSFSRKKNFLHFVRFGAVLIPRAQCM